MRNISTKILVIAGLMIGCSRSAPAPERAAATIEPAAAQLTCKPPAHLCIGCNGREFCGIRCPECAPSVAPAAEQLEATPVADLICRFPERRCLTCTGGQICARFCPECPAPLAPRADDRAASTVAVIGETCGGRICSPGTHCCNPSCGTCTPKGVECTQQSCN